MTEMTWPTGPIVNDWLTNEWFAADDVVASFGGSASIQRRTGITRGVLWTWTVNGHIRADHCDRLAVALGYHPSQLWTDWWSRS